jgi:hypothetical protein
VHHVGFLYRCHTTVYTTHMLYIFILSPISISLRNFFGNLKLPLCLIIGTPVYDCIHKIFNTLAHKRPHFRMPAEGKHSSDCNNCWYSSHKNNQEAPLTSLCVSPEVSTIYQIIQYKNSTHWCNPSYCVKRCTSSSLSQKHTAILTGVNQLLQRHRMFLLSYCW